MHMYTFKHNKLCVCNAIECSVPDACYYSGAHLLMPVDCYNDAYANTQLC